LLDLVIKGGTVVDGTGAKSFHGDVGINGGRIVAAGEVNDAARRTVSADGLVVAPGFVDPHTHYDGQLFWDPSATPSSWHGVTSVIAGNCGFTLAPLNERDADYTRRMMAQVEGMPLSGLEQGVPWSWETFGQFLHALEGGLAVNAGFLVGHCALRRYVMGEDFARVSTAGELKLIGDLLEDAIASGAIGFSTTRSSTHNDEKGDPVPSRWASEEEVLHLCELVGRHDGMSLEFITEGCLWGFSDEEVELMVQMSLRGRCPLNWNVLSISSEDSERVEHQLEAAARAREAGGRIVALTMPILMVSTQSFLSYGMLQHMPGWFKLLDLDVPEYIRRLKDPAVRAELMEEARTSKWGRSADFAGYRIGDVFSPQNEKYRNRVVGDIAEEMGLDPFAALVEILVPDELRTVLWPPVRYDSEADWDLRRQVWEHPDILLGGSDAGAHLDRLLGSPYPTRFLADVLRGRQQVPVERAVQLMTDVPARLFGLRGRGRIARGFHADVVLFDPDRIDAGAPYIADDVPGGGSRLVAGAVGIERVFVNGIETAAGGKATGASAGTVLRSGRDTSGWDR
jgi:N-acyl-D-aspartate/D-glutamate deacylase